MKATTLNDYFCTYGKLLQQNAQASMLPLHVPGRDAPPEIESLRKPFEKQRDVISGAVKALKDHRGLFICGSMGTGKTIMGQLSVHTHANGKPYRALVFCPGQLTVKWERELRQTIPGVEVVQLTEWRDVLKLDPSTTPAKPTWYIISRDRAKLGAKWQPAIIHRHRMEPGIARCPKCGCVQEKNETPLEIPHFAANKRRCSNEDCGEQLWQFNRDIDRWEPAWYIKRHLKGFFRYLVLDEVHEEKSASSAQANAAGSLIAACRYTLALTGTLIGGYADHIRPLLFRLCPRSVVEEGFSWSEAMPFSEVYGRIETRITTKDSDSGNDNAMSRGKTSRSTRRGVKPGIVPTLVRHLIGNTMFLSLEDVADNLPSLDEQIVAVDLDSEMATYYKEMEADLTKAVKQAFSSGAKKMLGPMLNGLLNWPDHPYGWSDFGYTDKDGNWNLVHRPYNFPSKARMWPKEEELINLVKRERAEGRQVWVYVQLTDKHDVAARLGTFLEAEGMNVKIMRSTVAPPKREAWIEKNGRGADVVISHPKLVETGLDLFDKGGNHNFSTLVFYETGYNLFTMRQAARRSWRIGQHLPCRVYYMYYAETMQERALTLMGRKLSAAEALEGKFSSEGLAAMVGEDDSLELEIAKSLAAQAADVDAKAAWQTIAATPKLITPAPKLSLPPAVTQPAAPVAMPVVPANLASLSLVEKARLAREILLARRAKQA